MPTTDKEGLKTNELNGWQTGCNEKRVRGQRLLARFFCAAWNDRKAFLRFQGIRYYLFCFRSLQVA